MVRFVGAKADRVVYIEYPNKIAVVIEFDRVVKVGLSMICCDALGCCVWRVSFDRRSHYQGDTIRFCEVPGVDEPIRNCLAT